MGDGTLDHRPQLDEAVVIVDKLGLAHERGQRDARLLGVKRHLDDRAVVAHAAQQDVDALVGVILQAEVLPGFKQEVTVDHPQAAIDGGADLENGRTADDLACLQDVAGTGHDHVHDRRVGHRERQIQLRQPVPKGTLVLQCLNGPAIVEVVVVAVVGRHHDRTADRLARRQHAWARCPTPWRGGSRRCGTGLSGCGSETSTIGPGAGADVSSVHVWVTRSSPYDLGAASSGRLKMARTGPGLRPAKMRPFS